MTKATAAFTARNAAGQLVRFSVGETVPDDIAQTVGAHVLDSKPDAPEEDPLAGVDTTGADEALKAALTQAVTDLSDSKAYVVELEDEVEKLTTERDELRAFKDTILSGNLEDLDLDALRKDDEESEDNDPDAAPTAPVFDPSEHGVDKVLAYLESADPDEDARVRAAEKAGKNRKGILGDED